MTHKGIVFLLLLVALIWSWNSIAQHASTQAQSAHTTSSLTQLAPAQLQSAEAVQGGPTISAAFADRILAAAHSPATGIGATLYHLSQQYGIDNAIALAFFRHESSFGTRGMAVQDKSWGNIRCTPGWARCDASGGYRVYSSWTEGLHDWFQLITTSYLPRGLNTVSLIVPVYAPSADGNDEHAYITSVLESVLAYREGRIA